MSCFSLSWNVIYFLAPDVTARDLSQYQVNGNLINTGRGIIFKVAGLNSGSLTSSGSNKVTVSSHHVHSHHGSSSSSGSSSPSGTSSVHLVNSAGSNSIPSSAEILSPSLLLPSSGSSSSSSSSSGSFLLLDVQENLEPTVVIGSGPLSYQYTLHHLSFHYGRELTRGSEHTISNFQFPGEIQFYCFNSQLYSSWDEAVAKANGIAAISVLIQISPDPKMSNQQLKRITHALRNITSKGNSQWINSLSIQELMPETTRKQYITYEGSLTQPACHETVQWIILNKPIYMTSHLFHSLRNSMQNEASHSTDNYRPIQKLNGRSLRTNIGIDTCPRKFVRTYHLTSSHLSSTNSVMIMKEEPGSWGLTHDSSFVSGSQDLPSLSIHFTFDILLNPFHLGSFVTFFRRRRNDDDPTIMIIG